MAEIVISNLVQHYGNVLAVDGVSLRVNDGELVSLLGPSGCGKSTTLAALAGLERPTSGSIIVGGVPFFDSSKGIYLPPEARNCGLVFQSYALWPHMSVIDNCAFALKLRKISKADQKKRVMDALELVEMQSFGDRFPYQLSGGQQQRVALARTLTYEPTILLLDEPLSNLDAKLRERARSWLRSLQKKVGLTTVFVTHDQSEALAMSDRVAVMNGGKIIQYDTPQAIYDQPKDRFVADFIGSSVLLRTRVAAHNGDSHTLILPDGQQITLQITYPAKQDELIDVAIRAETLNLIAGTPARPTRALKGQISNASYLGSHYECDFTVGQVPLRIETTIPLESIGSGELWAELTDTRYAAFPA
ncbi:ABC transporter ATP-binding protein [Candidimonas sp. SYP-B2681]|uniref:ABC transporter ATP-binding protein n=1 Tax=Candidimonas sp. SYP-B2681 TaxID=2497686 RepID=UPI000F8814A2|nr:ABC transporter ATP-binding protein [Candidimonas sp. SYP-B2681]RTZ43235.1 ABC transporter ATP-binding protein [Candidimonas sp. SYP-B2681]